jgi:molybdenum cofactor biosynthesis enzyme MoaA
VEFIENFQLNVRNIGIMLGRPARAFGAIRFDSNNDCNVHCVYCHNSRSKELIDADQFRTFLSSGVISVEQFQFGCTMEPTLDARLCDFMEIVARSPARPQQNLRLQTNGILLHRHDAARMRAAGLSHLSVSVDSAKASTHKDLRGGTSLAKVERNLREFHHSCPAVHIVFLTTVTSANLENLGELVTWGLDVGVEHFVFRQMFYDPRSPVVDHSRMPSLCVSAEEFARFRTRLKEEFASRVHLDFLDDSTLASRGDATQVASELREAVALRRRMG